MPALIQTATDLLAPADFARLRALIRPRRGGPREVYGNLQDARFLAPLRQATQARFPQVRGLTLQQALLRFEARTGLLHHDLNHRPDRRFSVIFYIDVPESGGEIVFPFFDAAGRPVDSPVTARCRQLAAAGQLYAEEPELEEYIQQHRAQLLSLRPRANAAVGFPAHDPAAWHYACPVAHGERSCFVLFYRKD